MRVRYTHIMLSFALVLGIMLVLAGFAWMQMRERLTGNETLNATIAEMARIDEVLTTSALLAAATGDMAYHRRYYAHVEKLDTLLAEAMNLFDADRADEMLLKTHKANIWLVETEERALEAMQGGPDAAGYASLRSEDYARNKRAYANGLDATIDALETMARQRIDRVRAALWGLAATFAVAAGALAIILLRIQFRHRELVRQQQQVAVMRGMIATFMDLQNNLLNNMVYFRIKAACDLPLDSEDIRMIDDEIARSKAKLEELVDSGIGTTRDLGGIVIIETSDAAPERAAA